MYLDSDSIISHQISIAVRVNKWVITPKYYTKALSIGLSVTLSWSVNYPSNKGLNRRPPYGHKIVNDYIYKVNKYKFTAPNWQTNDSMKG